MYLNISLSGSGILLCFYTFLLLHFFFALRYSSDHVVRLAQETSYLGWEHSVGVPAYEQNNKYKGFIYSPIRHGIV